MLKTVDVNKLNDNKMVKLVRRKTLVAWNS